MKKMAYFFSITLLITLSVGVFAQNSSLDVGIFNYPLNSDKLEIRLKPNQKISNSDYTGGIFTIRFPTASGVTLSNFVNPYGYEPSKISSYSDGFSYCSYSFVAGSRVNKLNWQVGQENVILTLQTNAAIANNITFELVTGQPWNEKNGGNYYQELNADASVGAQNSIYHASTDIIFKTKLLSFKVEKSDEKTAVLWETIAENSTAYYTVERSKDGSNFKGIEYFKPKSKKEDEKVAYSYLDEKPELGINYYRLLIKDIKDNTTYSKIDSVDFGTELKSKIYPNPFSRDLSIEIDIKENIKGNVLIELFDMGGKQIIAKNVVAQGRNFSFNLPAEDLLPGTYMIRLTNGSFVWQNKVTKY